MSYHPAPQPPYPALTLDSTLRDVLDYGCERSDSLDDSLIQLEYIDPWDIRISWPGAVPQKQATSLIMIRLNGRPSGGARIGIWESEPIPPPNAPSVTALNPATAPAGADVTVDISGADFDAGATVNIGRAWGLVPTIVTNTDLSVVFSGSAHIQYPGRLGVSVKNPDGQVSNALNFTVT